MKNDFSFKIVAAVIVAGVIVAFASPSPGIDQPAPTAPAVAATVADAAPAAPVGE